MTSQVVIRILALLTLASNIGVVVYFIFLLAFKNGVGKRTLKHVFDYLTEKAVLFSFFVASVATAGSLYLSEVAHFTPCILCWYQRIFMYPLVVILGAAVWKKRQDVWNYALPLAAIGTVIAGYHYKIQISPDSLLPCSTVGFSVSCTERFFTYFGYITIPLMSFSAFVLITIGMFLTKKAAGVKNGR